MIDDSYVKKIGNLSKEKQLLLGLCYVERNLQVVKEFDEFYNEELSGSFANKLEKAFNLLLNELPNYKDIQESLEELEKMLPDSEDYPEAQGGLALNGLIMLCYCFRFIITNQSENIVTVLNLTFETVDFISYEVNNNCDCEIEFQKEFTLLDGYLEILNDCQAIDEKIIVILRETASKNMFANSIE